MQRRRQWAALALVTLASWTEAQDEAPSLAAFLLRKTGSADSAQCHHIAGIALPHGRRHVGLITSCTDNVDGSKQAWVFVADEAAAGPIKLQALSTPFDFAGRHYVELTQAQSAERFSIQINYRGCGGGFDLYRFALRAEGWVVAGRDSQRWECGSREEGVGAARQERSANFLSGEVEERDYQRHQVIARRRHVEAFPRFPLGRFDPFDAAYGER